MTVAKAVSNEQRDREVDQVALGAQDLAISRLQSLLKKHRDSSQEAVFLSKLADIQQQKAAIQFRLAHGAASRGGKALDLSAHHKTMSQSIASLDRLIARYPNFEEIPHAYFARGKAYEEIENKAKAGQDYLYLVQKFPTAEDSTSAHAARRVRHRRQRPPRAITYLKEVEKRPEDPHYPFALYKLAWSYYNLKQIPESLGYAERQIAFYSDRAKRVETGFDATASDIALRENTLLDVAVFYFEGYEQKSPAYSVDKAMDLLPQARVRRRRDRSRQRDDRRLGPRQDAASLRQAAAPALARNRL